MADNASRVALLRPLGFGELFDRAVTLYVRNFVPLTTIVLVLLVPWAVVQYVIDAGQSAQIAEIVRAIGRPGEPPTAVMPGSFGVLVPLALVFVVLILFALNAVAVGVARIYTGRSVDVRECYRASFARWAPALGTIGMGILVFFGWYFTFIIVALIFGGIAAGITALSRPVGIVFLIIAALAVLAMLVVLVLLMMAVGFAMFAAVIERRGVLDALGAGFSRIFRRDQIGRAALFALCTGLLYMVYALVVSGGALYAMYAHMLWLAVIVSTVGQALYSPFSVVLFAVYYYDVRIRREGLDVEAGLEGLVPAPTA